MFRLCVLVLTLILIPAGSAGLAAQVRPPSATVEARLTAEERRLILDTLGSASSGPAPANDTELIRRLMSHARRELGLRLRPSSIDRLWGLAPAPRDLRASFGEARASGNVRSWLAGLSPPHPQYSALQTAAERYRAAAATPFRPLPPLPSLREGDVNEGLASVRRRLAEEGYPQPPTDGPHLFDARLKAALVQFQQERGLGADGVLGPATLAALNVSPSERLAQIEANLERLRWLPRDLPPDRVEVNVAAAEAALIRAGEPVLEMRAVVGDTAHKTPMFASQLEAIVFNPPWNVPTSIARNEIWPKVARDPGYLARNHFVSQGGQLRQLPGPGNALGQIKFDLRSPYGVYLHDTPAKSAFQRARRTLSHGCMRLEKPRELAQALLAPQGWSPAEVETAIAAGTTRRVDLSQPTPLFVLYLTASVIDDRVRFTPDPYGWDAKLNKALAGMSLALSSGPRATDCTEARSTG